MQRILFIGASGWNEASYPVQGAMGGMSSFPPIGMLYISSYLKSHCDVETRLFDYSSVATDDYAAIDPLLETFQPDIVGLTSYTFILYDIYRICRHVRQKLPSAKIVLGGKQVELYPHQTLEQEFVDYIVVGEGEKPMRELVNALESGRTPGKIAGLWFRRNGKLIEGGRADRLTDLDSLPHPDMSIIEATDYCYKFGSGLPETVMITSRGCPFACRYCMSAHCDRLYVSRTASSVVDEAAAWAKRGYRVINFFDDNFNANLQRAKQICRGLIERQLPVTWSMRGSSERIDAEFAELLKRAGCERVILGIESANEKILADFGRKSNNEKIIQAFNLLEQAGVSTAGYFMLGFPGETATMVRKTIDFACSLPLDYAQFTAVFPAPGSPFFLELVEQGKMTDVYLPYTQAPSKGFELPYYEDLLTKEKTADLCKQAYRSFYMRPSLVMQHLTKLKSPTELYRKATLAAGLARYSLKGLFSSR